MNFEFNPSSNEQDVLKEFGRNITNEAKNNQLDPIIGRDEEIRRLIEVISRKTKNNPVLIGEPGVGKTAIVEGFAQRIVNKDVPNNLLGKEIIELSISNLIAGASFQGQFEQRIKSVLKEVKESNGEIILFIDEIHQLIGTGKTSGSSSMDAANILKPMMARGEIKIIGATTIKEYRKYIEQDLALERRMQKVIVQEPSKQEALTILRGLKRTWELFHEVKIQDSALVAAIDLSSRYITDRFLPDKAIDLVDEAAARIKTRLHSLPADLDEMNRQIIYLETARRGLKMEEDEKSKKSLVETEKQLEELKKKQSIRLEQWNKQKNIYQKINEFKKQIESNKQKIENLQQEGQFESASKLLYVVIPSIEKQLKQLEKEFDKQKNNSSDFTNVVTDEEIASVLSDSIHVPVDRLMENEKHKLLNLDSSLKKIVHGQDEAVELISQAILRNRAKISDPNRPIGSFLFLGPTGVGKTFLAKQLACHLFSSEKAMIRIDMSEYMEKHSVAKLIGAPPGYVGYDQYGILTEAVRQKPYSVILFDEIEKAHPDVLNILLQVLDDGQLRDNHNNFINFRNAIIIMTSNVASQLVLAKKHDEALAFIKKSFTPEFLNRIDEVVIFNSLTKSNLKTIIEQELTNLQDRLSEQDINIRFDDSVIDFIAKGSYDENFGARPIRRFIQKNIENVIAVDIISEKVKKDTKYSLICKNNKIVLEQDQPIS